MDCRVAVFGRMKRSKRSSMLASAGMPQSAGASAPHSVPCPLNGYVATTCSGGPETAVCSRSASMSHADRSAAVSRGNVLATRRMPPNPLREDSAVRVQLELLADLLVRDAAAELLLQAIRESDEKVFD